MYWFWYLRQVSANLVIDCPGLSATNVAGRYILEEAQIVKENAW